MKYKFALVFLFLLTALSFGPSKAGAISPQDIGLKEGDLISSFVYDKDPDIFIINQDGFKRLFLNPVIFHFYGHLKYVSIKAVKPEVKDEFVTSSFYRNCETGDSRVYALEANGEDTGALHHVNVEGATAVSQNPSFFKEIFCINKNEFNWYQKTSAYPSLADVPLYKRVSPKSATAALNFSKASSTFPLITAVPPAPGGRSVFLPLSLSLKLAKDSYEPDEYLDGTGSIANTNPMPAPAKFNLELYYKDTLVKTVPVDFPCTDNASSCIPAGTTPITPAGVLKALIGLDRIPPNPDLVGSWKLVASMIPANSAVPPTRIELPFEVTAQKPVTISVDGGSDRGQVKLMQGFLIGPPDGEIFSQPQLVADLKPKFWRTSQEALLKQLASFHTEITFETSDLYVHVLKHTQYAQDSACQPPNPPCTPINPWENTPLWQSTHPGSIPYDEYKDSIKTVIKYTVQNHLPIGYWEWWSEPNDYGAFGTEQRMFETFKAFHDAIRQAEKETGTTQKILAPNVSSIDAGFSGSYDGTGISHFLDYASQNHLRIDAIAWHELDADPAPETTPEHVARVRQMLAQKGFCPGSNCPLIYINEFSKAEHHLIPGWTAGRLFYFDQANIDGAGRSCWNARGDDRSWIDCYSLDGLFMQDNVTPQPLYWVHRLYADMDGDTRMSSQSSALRTTAIATKNVQTKTIRILASHYSCGKTGLWCRSTAGGQVNDVKGPPVDTTITIQRYPYAVPGASVQATFQLVQNPDMLPSPLLAPTILPPRVLIVSADGSLSIPLNVGDGDVYSIVLIPAQQAPVISEITPSSGPTGTKATLTGTGFTTTGNTVNFGGKVNAVIGLSSTDGKILSFAITAQLCNQLGGSAVCPPLQPGTYDVSIINANGTSNAVRFEVTTTTAQKFSRWPDTTENIHPILYARGAPKPAKIPTQELLSFIANRYDIIDNIDADQVKQARGINSKGIYLFDTWDLNGFHGNDLDEAEFRRNPALPPLLYYDNPSPQSRAFNNVIFNRTWSRAPTNPRSFKDLFKQSITQHLDQFGEDGIRADLLYASITKSGDLVSVATGGKPVWPVYDYLGNQYTDTEYGVDMTTLLNATKAAFSNKRAVTSNGEVSEQSLGAVDGIQREMFAVLADDLGNGNGNGNGRGRFDTYDEWKGEVSGVREAEKRNIAQLLVGVFSGSVTEDQRDIQKRRADTPDAIKARLFSLGSYLLAKGKRTYFYYSTNSFYFTGPYYFPEWNINIGRPVNDCDPIDTCKLANGLYQREFSNGMALINPNDANTTISLDLPATFYEAVLSGGNDPQLPADRGSLDTPGSLAYKAVNRVTLGPKDAVILLKSLPTK